MGRRQKGGGALSRPPLHPFSSDPPRPRGEARGQGTGEGQSLCGRENSRALRGSPCGGTLGWRAPRSRRGAEFLCQSPKARRVGWGRPFVWQLRRRGFGPQDAGLFTVGSPGPSEPPCGTGRLFTQQGERSSDQVLDSSLPRMRRGGASCVLQRLGVQMETSYSRVSPASYSGLLKSDSTVMGLYEWEPEKPKRDFPCSLV